MTQTEYQEVMGENPSNFTGDNLPVENLTWYEVVAGMILPNTSELLTGHLLRRTGKVHRLACGLWEMQWQVPASL